MKFIPEMPAIATSFLGLLMLVAVERRVDAIHTEYTRHAREADVKYHGVEQGPITQCLATMALTGMAFGMVGDASSTVHDTIQVMAEAKVAQQNRAWGRGEEEETGHLSAEVAYLRRRISSASVIAFGQMLAGRMAQVGGSSGAGKERRPGGRGSQLGWRRPPPETSSGGEDSGLDEP